MALAVCIDSPTRYFVHTLIDWNRVRRRLKRYPAIRSALPETMLMESSEDRPYYCHYMAWRLGTWGTDLSDTGIDVLAASWETGIDSRQARLVPVSARTPELREAVKWLVK